MKESIQLWSDTSAGQEVLAPVPVKCCLNKDTGEMVKVSALSIWDLYRKVMEEDVEAMEAYMDYQKHKRDASRQIAWAIEVMDSIFARYTMLSQSGIDLVSLVQLVYEKNRKRGYYDEV